MSDDVQVGKLHIKLKGHRPLQISWRDLEGAIDLWLENYALIAYRDHKIWRQNSSIKMKAILWMRFGVYD